MRRGLDERASATSELEHAAAWLAAVADSTDDALVASTLDGVITDWNPGATRLFGHDPARVIGRSVDLLLPPDRTEEHARIVAKVARGEVVRQLETVRLHQDGQPIDVLLTVAPIWTDGEVSGLSAIVRDRTIVVAAVRGGAASTGGPRGPAADPPADRPRRRPGAHAGGPVPGGRAPLPGVLLHRARRRSLRARAAPRGRPQPAALLLGRHRRDPDRGGHGRVRHGGRTGQQVIIVDALIDPLSVPFLDLLHEHHLGAVWSHPLVDRGGDILGTSRSTARPSTPPPAARSRSSPAPGGWRRSPSSATGTKTRCGTSLVDPLTGLPNRALFLDLLERSLRRAAPTPSAVLFLDLDRFKVVNDSMGHAAGDDCWSRPPDASARVRPGDDVLPRFGGDEFAVLVRRHATQRDAAAVADRVARRRFAEPFDARRATSSHVSVSIGIALGRRDRARSRRR